MKPEKEFDKIIHQRIEESEGDFPFDESNWQKASKLIDDERGVAGYYNNKRYLLLGALLLVLGSLGFFTYTYLHSAESTVASVNKGQAVLNENNENKIQQGDISTEYISKENKEKIIAGKSNTETFAETSSAPRTVESAGLGGTNLSSGSNNSSSDQGVVIDQQKNTISNKSRGKNSSPRNSFSGNSSHQGNKGASDNEAVTTENSGEISQAENEYSGSNMYENLYLNTKLAKMPAHNLDADIRKTTYDFIRIYRDDYFTSRKRKTFYLDAEAGTTYLFGWDVAKGKDAKGFNAYAGLNFGFHVKKKFSASIGAQVYNVSNITQPFYQTSSVSYNFGSNGTYTTITTNSLLYAAVPVKINYAINKRNNIHVGVNTAFLFNGMNTIETFNMADGAKSGSKIIHNTGYYEGTNQLNIMLTGGYSRAVTRRLKVNGEFMYGISDVYKNTSNNLATEKNMGVRLGLQYTLFDK